MMRTVPSNYHQLLRNPSLMETVDIRGDKAVARRHHSKENWVGGKECKSGLRPEAYPREEIEAGHCLIAITE